MTKSLTITEDLPADIQALLDENKHLAPSTAAEDNVIPLVYVLQDKMKYVKRNGPDYIEGAEPGMLLLRNAPDPLVNGDEGILFQPCHFYRDIVEWTPRSQGGGIVARHPHIVNGKLPDGRAVREVPNPENPKRKKKQTEDGNDLVETSNWIGLVINEADNSSMAYAIPMKGADHMVARVMNTTMQTAGGHAKPAYLFRLRTKAKSNNMGDWFGYAPELLGKVFDEDKFGKGDAGRMQFLKGKALAEAFISGKQRAAVDEDEISDAPAATGDEIPF